MLYQNTAVVFGRFLKFKAVNSKIPSIILLIFSIAQIGCREKLKPDNSNVSGKESAGLDSISKTELLKFAELNIAKKESEIGRKSPLDALAAQQKEEEVKKILLRFDTQRFELNNDSGKSDK